LSHPVATRCCCEHHHQSEIVSCIDFPSIIQPLADLADTPLFHGPTHPVRWHHLSGMSSSLSTNDERSRVYDRLVAFCLARRADKGTGTHLCSSKHPSPKFAAGQRALGHANTLKHCSFYVGQNLISSGWEKLQRKEKGSILFGAGTGNGQSRGEGGNEGQVAVMDGRDAMSRMVSLMRRLQDGVGSRR